MKPEEWQERAEKLWKKAYNSNNHIEAEKIFAEALSSAYEQGLKDAAQVAATYLGPQSFGEVGDAIAKAICALKGRKP